MGAKKAGVRHSRKTSRRPRRKRNAADPTIMRQAILDAARHLFVAGGYGHVPIRSVAAHLHYSAAALYRYFKTKDEIFCALVEEGFRLLLSRAGVSGLQSDVRPLDRLRRFLLNVYDFANTYPEYFYLMFLDRSVPRFPTNNPDRFANLGYDEMKRLLEDCAAAGEMPQGIDPIEAWNVLGAAMHGVAALSVCKRVAPGADNDVIARQIVDVSLTGLRHGALSSRAASAATRHRTDRRRPAR